MNTELVTTHELRTGDRVCHVGMVLLIDQEIMETGHPIRPDGSGVTLATSALIENWDEVCGYVGNLAHADPNGNHRWVIQGNGWARWSREVIA